MTRPPAVLAATDFTPRSAQVPGRAARLARVLGARLVLVHVRPAGPEGPRRVLPDGRVRPLLQRLRLAGRAMTAEAAAARLDAAAQAAAAAVPGLAIATRLLHGAPETAIVEAAAAEGAVLIVLGLHRERRVLDALRLTTMERIVLAAPVPLLLAHLPADRPYARVLALTDFSPASAAALAMAGRLAPEAAFYAVHALQLPLVAAVAAAAQREAAAESARLAAERQRAAFLARPGLPRLAHPPELVPGGVHEVLEFRRTELGADLVAIGSQSGTRGDALGHYARDLMRAPPTDLLVARPGAA
jgi:nucleotide-binding universal stress UspA family protein